MNVMCQFHNPGDQIFVRGVMSGGECGLHG
jgi:hypothetical protein